MTALPNPFFSSAVKPSAEEPAVASPSPSPSDDAAADRFILDVDAFMVEIEPPPLFLQPRVRADELIDVLAVLAGH